MNKNEWGNQVARSGLILGLGLSGLAVIQADLRLILVLLLFWGLFVMVLSFRKKEKLNELVAVAFFGPALPLYLTFGLQDIWSGEVSCKSRCPADTEAQIIETRCFCERTKLVKQLISPMDGKKP